MRMDAMPERLIRLFDAIMVLPKQAPKLWINLAKTRLAPLA